MILICLIIVVVSLIYYYKQYKYSYWTKRNVETFPATFLTGHLTDFYLTKRSYVDVFSEYYKKSKSDCCGLYQGIDPVLMVKNLDDIKYILVKNFNSFVNRGVYTDVNNNFLAGHLFRIENDKWKTLRNKLSPAFTTGKLKVMFDTIAKCGSNLEYALNKAMDVKNGDIDVTLLSQMYTIDVIASVGFGIEANCLKDNTASPFFKLGQDIRTSSLIGQMVVKVLFFGQSYGKIILKFFNEGTDELRNTFLELITNVVSDREKNKIVRKDFIQLLIELKNRGKIDASDDLHKDIFEKNNTNNFDLDMKTFTAQAFVLYFAGFDTSALTLTFILYYLASNQDIQRKLLEEIDAVLENNNNELTYNEIVEMEYLEMVMSETLRLRPLLGNLARICNETCVLPNTNVKIDVGTRVYIPMYNIQLDEKYFPNPTKFDPERFSKENISKIPNFAYLPFGDGPRFCIGMRLGKLQSKFGLISILRNHTVHLSEKTKLSPYAHDSIILKPMENMILNFQKRDSTKQ